MNKSEICQKLKTLLRKVIVVNGDVVTSAGSGIVINEDGSILTARHVISDNDGRAYLGKIKVSGLNTGGLQEYYSPLPLNLSFDMGVLNLINSINLDLIILKPVKPQSDIECIVLSDDRYDVGDDVIMAGFPDDIDEPFHFMDNLNVDNPDIATLLMDYNSKYQFIFKQQMFKHSIIGNRQSIVFPKVLLERLDGWKGPKEVSINGAIYWTDNHLTYGGSGGPLVNDNCELVGIMTEKAFTRLILDEPSNILIPSGTGMALSHNLLSWMLPHLNT